MYYFIGIKGTGMAALAVMLHDLGKDVCGSDLSKHFFTEDELVKRNIPIYDFIYFYKSDYLELEMSSLFDFYQSKFFYNNEEYLLFLALISLPEKIKFSRHHLKDCTETYKLIRYVSKTRDFILKENEKYQEENEDKFKE